MGLYFDIQGTDITLKIYNHLNILMNGIPLLFRHLFKPFSKHLFE